MAVAASFMLSLANGFFTCYITHDIKKQLNLKNNPLNMKPVPIRPSSPFENGDEVALEKRKKIIKRGKLAAMVKN